jgi:ribosome maturation factor RimP
MKPIDLNALTELVRPAVEAAGYELVDIEWRREQVGWVFRLFIDRRPGQGYVSHEDCANVSREVSVLLDVHDILPANYHLEVSSPGVNRPLKRPADFARFVGQRAKVRLRGEAARPWPGPAPAGEAPVPRRNFQGKIKDVSGNVVRLQVDDAGDVELAVEEMEKANLVYEP